MQTNIHTDICVCIYICIHLTCPQILLFKRPLDRPRAAPRASLDKVIQYAAMRSKVNDMSIDPFVQLMDSLESLDSLGVGLAR